MSAGLISVAASAGGDPPSSALALTAIVEPSPDSATLVPKASNAPALEALR